MPGEDTLLTIVEFGVALAGFTGVVVIFSKRDTMQDVDRFRLKNALAGSLGAAFFALLPSTLELLGGAGSILWRISSGLLAAYIALVVATSIRTTRRLDPASQAVLGKAPPFIIAIASLTCVLQLVNVSGLLFSPNAGVFVLGLIYLLGGGAFGFLRTLFVRPPL